MISTPIPAHQAEEWPTPLTLEGVTPSVQPFHPAMIPEPFRDWLTDIAQRMQCPLEYLAATTMVVTSAIVGTGCAIRPKQHDNWEVIPNLWGAIIGPPSAMKTPAMTEILRVLIPLEKQAEEQYRQAFEQYQGEEEAYKISLEDCKKRSGQVLTPVELKEKILALSKPAKPVRKRYRTTDSTVEKLIELLAENPKGLLVFWDELVGLLASWEKSGHESDRAFYLEAWSGKGSFSVDRIGRGTVIADLCCLSVLGGIQPDKLRECLLNTSKTGNDGMIQRFQLSVYPDLNRTFTYVDKKRDLEAEKQAHTIIHRLAALDFLTFGAEQDEDSRFPYYRFNQEAQEFFKDWFINLENEKLKQEPLPIMGEHLAKYRSLMPSLALLFHLIETAGGKVGGPVSLSSARLAALWCEVLESHARRMYELIEKPVDAIASILVQKILAGVLTDGFSARDAYRSHPTLAKRTAETKEALIKLEAAHWIMQAPIGPSGLKGGQRPSPAYRINPAVFL